MPQPHNTDMEQSDLGCRRCLFCPWLPPPFIAQLSAPYCPPSAASPGRSRQWPLLPCCDFCMRDSNLMRNCPAQQLQGVCPTQTEHPGCLSVQAQAGEPEHQCLKAHTLNSIDYLGALSLPLVGLRVEISKGDLDQSWALMHASRWGSQDHPFGADVGEESGGG